MKKTYISPAMLTVQLGTMHILAESLPVVLGGGGDETTIDNQGDILTKENRDVNLWDEEW